MNGLNKTRKLVVTALMAAVATILMFLDFSVPLVPSFLKMDFSELPALIASFSMGPLAGVAVCLVKNLINLLRTQTMGVGELSNFLLGSCFVFVSGLVYKNNKTKKNAVLGSLLGAVITAAFSLPVNFFLTYPAYSIFIPMDAIIKMYSAILPYCNSLIRCLVVFNIPFTFIKNIFNVLIAYIIYKPLSPVIKGKKLG